MGGPSGGSGCTSGGDRRPRMSGVDVGAESLGAWVVGPGARTGPGGVDLPVGMSQ